VTTARDAGAYRLWVGTVKGMFRFVSDDRVEWRLAGMEFVGTPVHALAYDPAAGVLYAGVNSVFYGPSVRRSRDLGASWETDGAHGGIAYGGDDPERVTAVWALCPAGDRLYAGVEASGLFVSEDGGDGWRELTGLRAHPTHELWNPGNGGKCLHTVVVDPFDPERLYVAASAGGVYRSDDGGGAWTPVNRGIRADFLPADQRYPVAGQCVHKLAATAAQRGRLWLQNHGGVYRSDDGGESWHDVGAVLPSDFGFGVVAHPRLADTAFVVPLTAPERGRWSPGERLAVYRTDDGGAAWRPLDRGLPGGAYVGVLRDAFAADGDATLGLYLGTTGGEVFASPDEGERFAPVATRLPRVLAVRAARVAP
jgi:hypothetical protein